MPILIKQKCDKCGYESSEELSLNDINGFEEIKIEVGNYTNNNKNFILCHKCLLDAQLLDENKAPKYIADNDNIKILIDTISEIVKEKE